MENSKRTKIIAWILIVCLIMSSAATLIFLYSQKKIRDSILNIPDNVIAADLVKGKEILNDTGFSVSHYSDLTQIKEYFKQEPKAYPSEMVVAEYTSNGAVNTLSVFYSFATSVDLLEFLETADVNAQTTYIKNGNNLLLMTNYDAGCLIMCSLVEKDGVVYVIKPDKTLGIVAFKNPSADLISEKRAAGKKVTSVGSYAIPSNVSRFSINKFIDTLYINSFAEAKQLNAIDVVTSNEIFCSKDGILYNEDKTSLLICPAGKEGEVEMEGSVINIADYAFSGCDKITSVNFSDALKTIGNLAFYNCTNLTYLEFKENLSNIGTMAFFGCKNLNTVKFNSITPPQIDSAQLLFSSVDNLKIKVLQQALQAYKESENFDFFKDILEGV